MGTALGGQQSRTRPRRAAAGADAGVADAGDVAMVHGGDLGHAVSLSAIDWESAFETYDKQREAVGHGADALPLSRSLRFNSGNHSRAVAQWKRTSSMTATHEPAHLEGRPVAPQLYRERAQQDFVAISAADRTGSELDAIVFREFGAECYLRHISGYTSAESRTFYGAGLDALLSMLGQDSASLSTAEATVRDLRQTAGTGLDLMPSPRSERLTFVVELLGACSALSDAELFRRLFRADPSADSVVKSSIAALPTGSGKPSASCMSMPISMDHLSGLKAALLQPAVESLVEEVECGEQEEMAV